MTRTTGNLVLIRWADSHAQVEARPWIDRDAINHKIMEIASVGWIVKETKKVITLASGVSLHGTQVQGVITIPKCCVLERKLLQED